MKKIILSGATLAALALLGGCARQNTTINAPQGEPKQTAPEISEKSCQADGDCACGRRVETRECFFGNAKYVDPNLKPCPDFCGGLDGKMQTRCVNGECKQSRD